MNMKDREKRLKSVPGDSEKIDRKKAGRKRHSKSYLVVASAVYKHVQLISTLL